MGSSDLLLSIVVIIRYIICTTIELQFDCSAAFPYNLNAYYKKLIKKKRSSIFTHVLAPAKVYKIYCYDYQTCSSLINNQRKNECNLGGLRRLREEFTFGILRLSRQRRTRSAI